MTSASTASAGKSNSCPTGRPAPPAPTAKPSSAATDHPQEPNPAAKPGPANPGRAETQPPAPPQPNARDRQVPRRPRPAGTTPAAGAATPRHRSAVEHPHLGLGVVVAGRRGQLGELPDLLRRQLDGVGGDVLLEAGDAPGARNRGDVIALG